MSEQDGDPVMTFEDVEPYQFVVYRDCGGYILDKGDHVLPHVADEYVSIDFIDTGPAGNSQTNLSKTLVNKYLRKKEKLFVDFGHHIEPAATPSNQD